MAPEGLIEGYASLHGDLTGRNAALAEVGRLLNILVNRFGSDWELFDMRVDRLEANDLAARMPCCHSVYHSGSR